jgi:hypothetical protein
LRNFSIFSGDFSNFSSGVVAGFAGSVEILLSSFVARKKEKRKTEKKANKPANAYAISENGGFHAFFSVFLFSFFQNLFFADAKNTTARLWLKSFLRKAFEFGIYGLFGRMVVKL